MNLIDKEVVDILPGYSTILWAENNLRANWRAHLLAAYAERLSKTVKPEKPRAKLKLSQLLALVIGLFFFFVGLGITCRGFAQREESLFLWFCCGGPLLGLLGFLILGALGFSRTANKNPQPHRVPLHPLRSGSNQQGIYPDIRTPWIEGLNGGLKQEIPDYPDHREPPEFDYGAQGERSFIRQLGEILDNRYFLIARSMQRPKEERFFSLRKPAAGDS